MSITVYIVNLRAKVKRRQFMELQAGELPAGFHVEFVDAVNGRALTDEQVQADYDPAVAVRNTGRELSRGEIGCALSHRAIYRRMIERGETHAVVLEDDVALGEHFPEVCQALADHVPADRPRIVLLGDFYTSSLWSRRLWRSYRLMRVWRGRYACAYIITRAAARALDHAQTPVRRAADWWPDMERNGIMETWGVSPGCVMTGLHSRNTGIGEGRAQLPIGLLMRVARKLQTVWFQCRSWRN